MFALVYNQSKSLISLLMTGLVFIIFSTTSYAKSNTVANDIADSVPAQIPEMITGGTWRKGNIGGYYRAMVVLSDVAASAQKKKRAEVVIQWIGKEDGTSKAKIFKTINVKEVRKHSLQHAFLSMDTLKDNEMTLLVSSFDIKKNKDISISVKATMPGEYKSK